MSATTSEASSPEARSESRGSSVSTGLREEYEDLLRYAVVTPKIESLLSAKPTSSHPLSGNLPQRPQQAAPRQSSKGRLQPELSRVESEERVPQVSEPLPAASPVINPPPPFTAMNIQEHINALPRQALDENDGSHDQPTESHDISVTDLNDHNKEEEVIQPLGADPEMVRLETQMDVWCLDLKRNVLAEFEQARIRIRERHQSEVHKERQQHYYEFHQLQEELERYKELLVTYEQSISRKDHIIANLTKALQKQKERVDLGRSFSSWKIRHIDDKRESFTTSLARCHYQRKIKSRVWAAWFGLIQGRWKQRVEKACQNKAEEVCMQLTGEYEERLEAIQHSFDESQQEVVTLKAERDLYEENMKKAFMRGICALNLEAMSMFRQNEAELNDGDINGVHGPSPPPPGDENIASGDSVPQYQRQLQSKMIHVTASAGPKDENKPFSISGGQFISRTQSGMSKSRVSRKPVHSKTPNGRKPAIVVERHIGTSEHL